MNKQIYISHKDIRQFMLIVLKKLKVSPKASHHVIEGLIQTSLRGVDSHGIRLFPHYVHAAEAGRLNLKPKYKFTKTAPSTGTLDGDHTFGHAACAEAMQRAIKLAKKSGMGAVTVYNSSHFGAAAYYALMAAEEDMLGFSFTHADSLLLSAGSKQAYFGTNPICFAAPCAGEGPFCLDMATSVVPWNRILQYREGKKSLSKGWGSDAQGRESLNPMKVMSVLPMGGYKGFGLAMMIDILCGVLSGMPFGHDITSMYKHPIDKQRYLGQFFMVLDISRFQKITTFKRRLKKMMTEVRNEPRKDKKVSVQVAGDPEKASFVVRSKKGIPMTEAMIKDYRNVADKYQSSDFKEKFLL